MAPLTRCNLCKQLLHWSTISWSFSGGFLFDEALYCSLAMSLKGVNWPSLVTWAHTVSPLFGGSSTLFWLFHLFTTFPAYFTLSQKIKSIEAPFKSSWHHWMSHSTEVLTFKLNVKSQTSLFWNIRKNENETKLWWELSTICTGNHCDLEKKTHYECVFELNAHIVEVFLVCLPRNICFVNCFCKDCCSTFACVQKHFACDYKHCMRQFGSVQNYETYCLKLCSKVSRSMWHK